MKKLLLCVAYTARPGMRERFVREMEESGLLETIRAEEGCLGYDYYYPASGADAVLLVEKWASEEHQKRHAAQPYMERLKAIKERYIAGTAVDKAFAEA